MQVKQQTTYSTNFQSFNIKSLRNGKDAILDAKSSKIGNIIGQKTSIIRPLIQDIPADRSLFMDKLVANYNLNNFRIKNTLKDNSDSLLDIFNSVKTPQAEHFSIVSKSDMPFETLKTVFDTATDKKSLSFVETLQRDILDGSKESAGHIIEMLKSPNREKYLKNPQEYKSYLVLNSENKDAIKNLDKLVNEGNYNKEVYDIKLSIQEMSKNKKLAPIVNGNEDIFENYYSKEGTKLLNRFTDNYINKRHDYTYKDIRNILDIYKTTTKENIKSRLEVIDQFRLVDINGQNNGSEIDAMNKLFTRMDENKHAQNFVHNALGDGLKIENIKELNNILDTIPAEQAEIFHKNIVNIVKNTNPEERKSALLKDIKNPFFSNPQNEKSNKIISTPSKKPGLIMKCFKFIENKINIERFNRLNKPQMPKTDTQHKVVDFIRIPTISESLALVPQQNNDGVKLLTGLVQKPNSNTKKLKIKSDIQAVISQKLGTKTYENQQERYSTKATIMRLKLLPEIFESISSTRKSQKLEGKSPSVDNRDALKLYEKINGKNKKLVRYMLKQTDSENKRIFTIRDIIKTINTAENEILKNKMNNPNYKAVDAKEHYNRLYLSIVEEHGKLKTKK